MNRKGTQLYHAKILPAIRVLQSLNLIFILDGCMRYKMGCLPGAGNSAACKKCQGRPNPPIIWEMPRSGIIDRVA